MSENFLIIGGDLRNIMLAKSMAKDGNIVYTYGLEKSEEIKELKKSIQFNNLQDAVESSNIIIGPTPFTKDEININTPFSEKQILIKELIQKIKNKTLIAGSIKQNVYDLASENNVKIIDFMKKEEVAILNAISTVEGAIEIIIKNTDKILHGSNILILGFGRIGKVLAKKLSGLSVNITCAARKEEDFAWITAYGYKTTNINLLKENLSQYDIIINTVPHMVLTKERLNYVKKDCLIIDLASKPGGIDQKIAEEKGIKSIWALALPGKVAPFTTAEIIKKAIYDSCQP